MYLLSTLRVVPRFSFVFQKISTKNEKTSLLTTVDTNIKNRIRKIGVLKMNSSSVSTHVRATNLRKFQKLAEKG